MNNVQLQHPNWSPVQIESSAEFVIYSEDGGVISEHQNEGDTMKAFVEHLKKHKEPLTAEPVIYKHDATGWELF